MKKRFFINQEVLFQEGDISDAALIIQSGRVSLSKLTKNGFSKEIKVLDEGDIIGEVSLITKSRHSVTATALEDGCALVLTREDYLERLGKSDHVLALILKSLSKRLRSTY